MAHRKKIVANQKCKSRKITCTKVFGFTYIIYTHIYSGWSCANFLELPLMFEHFIKKLKLYNYIHIHIYNFIIIKPKYKNNLMYKCNILLLYKIIHMLYAFIYTDRIRTSEKSVTVNFII